MDTVRDDFFDNVAATIEQARAYVGRTADLMMCVTYFEIGRMIVEKEQGGKKRAEYGRRLLEELATYLAGRFGKGFSVQNLRNFRKFYLIYEPSIRQTMSVEFKKGQLPADESGEKTQSLIAKFGLFPKGQSMITEFAPFRLSWSHYIILLRIKDDQERRFYEVEAANQQWTVRQLQRQYGSSLYERLALSRDKAEVMRLASEGQIMEKPRDMLKNPLVLEFLGMEERTAYSESDLESAIISQLQAFLLELGKGFLFEARQKRFSDKPARLTIFSNVVPQFWFGLPRRKRFTNATAKIVPTPPQLRRVLEKFFVGISVGLLWQEIPLA